MAKRNEWVKIDDNGYCNFATLECLERVQQEGKDKPEWRYFPDISINNAIAIAEDYIEGVKQAFGIVDQDTKPTTNESDQSWDGKEDYIKLVRFIQTSPAADSARRALREHTQSYADLAILAIAYCRKYNIWLA